MAHLASGVEDNFSPNEWQQIVTKESARPDDLPRVHFDYDKRGVMSVNLALSGQRTQDIVHKLHDCTQEIRLLSLGEAFARVQTYTLDASLNADEQQYHMSLAWQVHQELKRLSGLFHRPWTTVQRTEFCRLMLGVLIGAPCLQGVDVGRLDNVFTIKEEVWMDVKTAENGQVRNVFFDCARVNPHGLNITCSEIERRLCNIHMDEQTRSSALSICGYLELTSIRFTNLDAHSSPPDGEEERRSYDSNDETWEGS